MKAARVKARLRVGHKLHMQIVSGALVWWFEDPHENVPDSVVAVVLMSDAPLLREAGDSLFGLPLNSQTWEAGND